MKKTKPGMGHYKLMRSVATDKVGPLRIVNKDMMRNIVTDYIIHKSATGSSHKIHQVKYQPIRVKIDLNSKESIFTFDLTIILEKFVAMEKQNLDSQSNIESIIVGILQFIDKFEDQLPITLQMQNPSTPDNVLGALLAKYFKDRQRKFFQSQFQEIRKKKNTRNKNLFPKQFGSNGTQFYDEKGFSEENSQRVSRNTIIALEKEEHSKKRFPAATKSKLKNLVDSCNVFEFPDRVEALKREKLIGQYCKNAIDFAQIKQNSKKHYPCKTNSSLAPETAKMLEEWINEISLSEKLFKNKFDEMSGNIKKKIQSSSSEQSDQQE